MAKLGPMTDARSKKKQNKKRKITPVTGARKKAIIKRYKTSHLPASFRGANIFARTIKKRMQNKPYWVNRVTLCLSRSLGNFLDVKL